jgi:hypothetical protein
MTTTTTKKIDWEAACKVAEGLGIYTRLLVDTQDPDAILAWALEGARASNGSAFSAPRAASYLELALLVGHDQPPAKQPRDDDERLEWLNAKIKTVEGELTTLRKIADSIATERRSAKEEPQGEVASNAAA